ncbi:MAG: 30S ribosomal protein S2 [Candidatus Hydrogenedentota bacterium]
MATISMKELLEAGIHFGHQTRRWNPKMGRYIFGERHGIYIIDLQKTLRQMQRAYIAVRDTVAAGGDVLFVGTKKQAQEPVKVQAERCGMYYINNRWLGGTLTNWQTIQNSIATLTRLQDMEESGKIDANYKKKEATVMRKRRDKLEKNLGGIQKMDGPPKLMFIVDSHRESIAVAEASRLDITSVAICDTNSDPDVIDIPIPGNDDAIRAINLFCSIVADAVLEGRMRYDKAQEEEAAKRKAKSAEETVKSDKLSKQQAKDLDAAAPADAAPAEESAPAKEAPAEEATTEATEKTAE